MALNYAYLIAPLAVFLAGLVPLLFLKQKYKIKRKIFILGAVAWCAAILAKSLFSILFNDAAYNILSPISIYLFYLYIGLLTGIFEIFIPLFIIQRFKNNFKDVKSQLGFGLSYGAFEAMVIGLINIIIFLIVLSSYTQLPQELLVSYVQPTEYYTMIGFTV